MLCQPLASGALAPEGLSLPISNMLMCCFASLPHLCLPLHLVYTLRGCLAHVVHGSGQRSHSTVTILRGERHTCTVTEYHWKIRNKMTEWRLPHSACCIHSLILYRQQDRTRYAVSHSLAFPAWPSHLQPCSGLSHRDLHAADHLQQVLVYGGLTHTGHTLLSTLQPGTETNVRGRVQGCGPSGWDRRDVYDDVCSVLDIQLGAPCAARLLLVFAWSYASSQREAWQHMACNTAAMIMQRTVTVLVRAVSVHVHASSHPLCCLQLCLQVLGESGHILLLSTQGRVCITQLCLQLTHQCTPTRKCAQGEGQALVKCLKQSN